MLQRLSSLIRYCLEKAANARQRATESKDAFARRDHLFSEDGWNTLARSEELRERLEHFILNQRNAGAVPANGEKRDKSGTISKRLIAIVDDNIAVRKALQRFLQSLNHAVSTFETAEEYLASDLMRDTGCLISDMQLPGISGADLQARLIADGYRIPTVFITGFFSETTRARVLAAGAIDYLTKPCNMKSLMTCIEKAFAMSEGPTRPPQACGP